MYRWDDSINIVDIKASVGKGDRSFNYVEQLRLYAWLWWESHSRSEQVSNLEIWYLGTGTVKSIKLPEISEMESYQKEISELYQLLRAENPSIEDCPPEPNGHLMQAGPLPTTCRCNPSRCKGCEYAGSVQREHD